MSVVTRLPAIRRNAEALRQQGRPERARDLLEPALDVSLDSFGPDHPDALETMRLLALAERDLGNLTGARRLLEEALAGGQYSLGEADPLMLTMSAQLAGIAAELGNRYEARRSFEVVARVGPDVLGVEHPAVAAARRYLGGAEPPAAAVAPDGVPAAPATGRASVPDRLPALAARPPRRPAADPAWGQAPFDPTEGPVTAGPPDGAAEPLVGPVRLSTGTGVREPTPPPATVRATRRFESAAPLPGDDTTGGGAIDGDGPAGEDRDDDGHPDDDLDDDDRRDDDRRDDDRWDDDRWDDDADPPSWSTPRQRASTEEGEPPTADPVAPDATGPTTDGPAQAYATAEAARAGRPARTGTAHGTTSAAPGHDLIYRPDATVATTRRPVTRTADPWTDRRPVPVSHTAPHHRSRAVVIALVAIGVLAVASAGAAFGTWLATRRGPAPPASVSPAPYLPPPPTASPAPSERLAAPTGVALVDRGSTVTLTWEDPTGGTVPFLVAGGHAGQTMSAFQTVDPGVHTYTVGGLNPSIDYCFTVVAVYGTNRLGTSGLVCTSRHPPSAVGTT